MKLSHLSFIAMALAATPAVSQTNNAVNTNAAHPTTSPTATQGANSFTEAQAKDRIMKAGYSSVEALTKNTDGIWSGKATKNGNAVTVMLDYKGNISEQ